MKFPERNLNQTAVYWASPQPDGYGGYTYDDPIEISCRWVDSVKVVKDKNGEEIVCRAEVQVDRDVDEGGVLYLGSLGDLTEQQKNNPKLVDGAFEIKRFDKIPDVKGKKYFRKVYL